MQKKIVTISRQYGSGGRYIGKKLSEKLGIPCYDEKLIDMVAKESRFAQDFVAEKGCKNGYVMWPVRTAVSGKQMTPGGATELMEILGKEESIARIKKGIELLSK